MTLLFIFVFICFWFILFFTFLWFVLLFGFIFIFLLFSWFTWLFYTFIDHRLRCILFNFNICLFWLFSFLLFIFLILHFNSTHFHKFAYKHKTSLPVISTSTFFSAIHFQYMLNGFKFQTMEYKITTVELCQNLVLLRRFVLIMVVETNQILIFHVCDLFYV